MWALAEAFGFFWNSKIKVDIFMSHPQFILFNTSKGNKDLGYVSIVYASPNHDLRKKLWSDLNAQDLNINGP